MVEGGQRPGGPTDEGAEEDLPERFSIVAGGAFHAVLGRLGFLEGDGLPGRRAAVGLALLAWLIPALLASAQSLLDDRYSGWDYSRTPPFTPAT